VVRSLPHRFLLFVPILFAIAASPVQTTAEPAKASQTVPQAPETRITAEQAKELFRSVDEILKFASQDTGLALRHEVKRALVNREQVGSYVKSRLETDEDAKRLQRSEQVLKKFGLLPRNFDLKTFLVALLQEQVAGYYDPKTKTVNLLDWIEANLQKPVLAHELTHALQDQDFDLEKWEKNGPTVEWKKSADQREPDEDEQKAARQAVIEGQGMLVLIDYILAPTGRTATEVPEIADAMKAGVMEGSPLFNTAPLYLKNLLLFPYRYGLDFERELLASGGQQAAFAGVLRNPPVNTRQIMQPDAYISGERLPRLPLADAKRVLGTEYEQLDVGGVGEFDVLAMLEQFDDADAAKSLAPEWRGGYYYAGHSKSSASGSLALLYVSRWTTPEQAMLFARAYRKSLKQKYKTITLAQMPQAATAPSSAAMPGATATTATRWNTEEGPVFVEHRQNLVIVMESFDEASAAKLRAAVLAADAQ